jgi:hypothetical protein
MALCHRAALPNTFLEEEARKRIQSGGNRDAITALIRRVKRLEQDQLNIRKAISRMEADAGDAAVDDFLAGLLADARKAAQDKLDAQEEVAALERQQHEWERVQDRLRNARVWCEAIAEGHDSLTYEGKRTVLFGLGTKVVVNAANQKPRASLKIGEQDIALLGEEAGTQNDAIVSLSSCPRASRSS